MSTETKDVGFTPEKYQTIREYVTAVQWFKLGDHPSVEAVWRNGHGSMTVEFHEGAGCTPTFALVMRGADWAATHGEVKPGDWIVQGNRGPFVKSDEWFRSAYELATHP